MHTSVKNNAGDCPPWQQAGSVRDRGRPAHAGNPHWRFVDMITRRVQGLVGMSLAATLTGCHLPANSPFTGLAQLRPTATPHTNVLPPAAMLQHPGPGVALHSSLIAQLPLPGKQLEGAFYLLLGELLSANGNLETFSPDEIGKQAQIGQLLIYLQRQMLRADHWAGHLSNLRGKPT